MVGIITTQAYVKDALDKLGNTSKSYGHWLHEIFGLFTPLLPIKLISRLVKKYASGYVRSLSKSD